MSWHGRKASSCFQMWCLAGLTALTILGLRIPAAAGPCGDVNGDAAPAILLLELCEELERLALEQFEGVPDDAPVPGSSASLAISYLLEADFCLGDVALLVAADPDNGDAFVQKVRKLFATALKTARKSDGRAAEKLADGRGKAGKVRREIAKALQAKLAMKNDLQGFLVTARQADATIPPARYGVPGDPFYANTTYVAAELHRNPLKSAGWEVQADNAKLKSKSAKLADGARVKIWEFRQRKRGEGPGSLWFATNRTYQPSIGIASTLGRYDRSVDDLGDDDNATICVGVTSAASALDFYEVCTRPIPGSVVQLQVFDRLGVGGNSTVRGNLLLPPGDDAVADLFIRYNLTYFETSVQLRGAPASRVTFAPVQTDPWDRLNISLGASDLVGKAALGSEGLAILNLPCF